MDEDEPHLTKTEARAGDTPHMTRVVLFVGIPLVAVLFAIIVWIWGS